MADKKDGSGAQGQSAEPAGQAPQKKMSKKEAVRRALGVLGRTATRVDIKNYVKDHFDIEMTADHASTTKGEILREEAGKGKSTKKSNAPKRAEETTPPADESRAQAGAGAQGALTRPAGDNARSGIALDDILAVKDLVERVGPDQLRTLIDVMTR